MKMVKEDLDILMKKSETHKTYVVNIVLLVLTLILLFTKTIVGYNMSWWLVFAPLIVYYGLIMSIAFILALAIIIK
ncbi:MAG: hypothetical protein ACQESN_08740 [Thermotogota bacterium]